MASVFLTLFYHWSQSNSDERCPQRCPGYCTVQSLGSHWWGSQKTHILIGGQLCIWQTKRFSDPLCDYSFHICKTIMWPRKEIKQGTRDTSYFPGAQSLVGKVGNFTRCKSHNGGLGDWAQGVHPGQSFTWSSQPSLSKERRLMMYFILLQMQ